VWLTVTVQGDDDSTWSTVLKERLPSSAGI
jgi:hypothetical protein